MKKPRLNCDECGREIARSKRIVINKTNWNNKAGDFEEKIGICFSCYKKNKIKQLRFNTIVITTFILMGITTFLIRDQLIFLSGAPGFIGLPNNELFYILTSFIFFGLALFFYFVQRKMKLKLLEMKILYKN